jgi:hypothetical protein
MKLTYAVLIAAGCAFAAESAGAATPDDVKWINQCVKDNKGGAADEVVLKFCRPSPHRTGFEEELSVPILLGALRHLLDNAIP